MSVFGTEPKKGSLAEAYFTGKEYCYSYADTYSLPAEITIDFIVRHLLSATLRDQSPFQQLIKYVRFLSHLKAKDQHEVKEECEAVKIGDELGYMRVIDRSPTEVLLIENYSTPNFFVSFVMDKVELNEYQLTISMNVLITGRFNKLYFIVCQPIQHTIASLVLKSILSNA